MRYICRNLFLVISVYLGNVQFVRALLFLAAAVPLPSLFFFKSPISNGNKLSQTKIVDVGPYD